MRSAKCQVLGYHPVGKRSVRPLNWGTASLEPKSWTTEAMRSKEMEWGSTVGCARKSDKRARRMRVVERVGHTFCVFIELGGDLGC